MNHYDEKTTLRKLSEVLKQIAHIFSHDTLIKANPEKETYPALKMIGGSK